MTLRVQGPKYKVATIITVSDMEDLHTVLRAIVATTVITLISCPQKYMTRLTKP